MVGKGICVILIGLVKCAKTLRSFPLVQTSHSGDWWRSLYLTNANDKRPHKIVPYILTYYIGNKEFVFSFKPVTPSVSMM